MVIPRVLLDPEDELILWYDHPAAYLQHREAWLVHQLVSSSYPLDGDTPSTCATIFALRNSGSSS